VPGAVRRLRRVGDGPDRQAPGGHPPEHPPGVRGPDHHDESFNEIGPAINSAQSIFFFGYPGNGKTSVAERITRLMGDAIYIPYAVEANGQVIKLYDPIQHTAIRRRTART
jgi:hypothetical protein